MTVTEAKVEAGAIALFAANNADGNVAMVSERWANYPDAEKDLYRHCARVVLEAACAT